MRRRITWRSAAAISMLGLAPGIGAAFAVPAGASTNECVAAYGTQCGTFTETMYGTTAKSGSNGGLGWDVKGQSSASNTPLIDGQNYSPGTDPGTDLTKVEHYGAIPGSQSTTPGTWYSIVYTPSGKWTSMCVANPDNKGMGGTNLVLRSCNGQQWQAFLAVAPRHYRRRHVLPPAPTSCASHPQSVAATSPALYSVANRRFVEGNGSRVRLFPLPAAPVRVRRSPAPTRGTGRTPAAPRRELAVN